MTPSCGHRKLQYRTLGKKVRARCVKCGLEGADHNSITEAYLAFRSDIEDARALASALRRANATR
jgi:hypothetical protein